MASDEIEGSGLTIKIERGVDGLSPKGLSRLYELLNRSWDKETEDQRDTVQDSRFLPSLLKQIGSVMQRDVLTVVVEPYHVDAVYRDSYYTCFSGQHFDVDRFSTRISLFDGGFSLEDIIFSNDHDIEDAFIGSCVINPMERGAIGRTLISPKYLIDRGEGGCCLKRRGVRTSKFKITSFGRPLTLETFPYRQQDELSYRCTEICLQNMIEYFSNEYANYGFVAGGKIRELEGQYTHERVLPSRGISYETASRTLSDMGFYPRVHTDKPDASAFRRTLYYYAESGIPTLVTMFNRYQRVGHSLLCVGRGPMRLDNESKESCQRRVLSRVEDDDGKETPEEGPIAALERLICRDRGISCVLRNMADLYSDLIVMDDNQLPFSERRDDQLSLHSGFTIRQAVVPLHRSMMLDASEAESTVYAILEHPRFGLLRNAGQYLSEYSSKSHGGDTTSQSTVYLRLFLASTRGFKRFRRETLQGGRRLLYCTLPLPHFVWVCELYHRDDLFNKKQDEKSCRAFGEIVIDATTNVRGDQVSSVILSSYPGRVTLREPSNPSEHDAGIIDFENDNEYWIEPYNRNLSLF